MTLLLFNGPEMKLTYEKLLSVMSYDPGTGHFTYRYKTHGCVRLDRPAGSLHKTTGYRWLYVDSAQVMEHRAAFLYMTGAWPSGEVDHIDGNRSNNKWSNLRDVPKSVNLQNQRAARADNSLGFQGVWKNGNRYASRIQLPAGKRMYLGSYGTPEEAHAAYIRAKRKFHEGCTI